MVVGGGDSGMQEALTLAEHVAKVVILERGDALTGQSSFREQVSAEAKIELRFGVVLSEILGESGVTHLRIKDVTTGEESDLAAAAVFACTGLVPNTKLLGGARSPRRERAHPRRRINADPGSGTLCGGQRARGLATSRCRRHGRRRHGGDRDRPLSRNRRWRAPD